MFFLNLFVYWKIVTVPFYFLYKKSKEIRPKAVSSYLGNINQEF